MPQLHRDQLSTSLKVSKSQAVRVQHWLQSLYKDRGVVHGEAALVPHKTRSSSTLVCTLDMAQKAIGCSWCGEWAADSGQPLQPYFKLIVLGREGLPYDIRALNLYPAVLYCEECWKTHSEVLTLQLDVDTGPISGDTTLSPPVANPAFQSSKSPSVTTL